MTFDAGMRGLSLDQAPPLSVPMSFFLTAPVALAGAGAVIAVESAGSLATRWSSAALAAVHLGTLGALAMTMLGALYQMLPVVAGAPVPAVRFAHAVHGLLVAGVLALVVAFLGGAPAAFVVAAALLTVAFASFLLPVAAAAIGARVRVDSVWGMRLVLPALVVVVALGVELALAHAGLRATATLPSRLVAHVGLGLVCWVGGLIVSVSFQVVPMFYLTEPYPPWARRLSLAALGATTLSVLGALAVDASPAKVAAMLAPGALAVWGLHPVVTLVRIARRRRRRVGESVRFWLAAMGVAPLVLASGAAAAWLDDPRFPVLFGWLALVGWSTLIVHGMLTRIVPFLTWFHRCSWRIADPAVPSVRELLPDARARVGLVLHLATLALGALAIGARSAPLAVAAGLGLTATGLAMLVSFARVVAWRRER